MFQRKRKIILITITIFAVCGILFFGFTNSKLLRLGPQIVNISPPDGSSFSEPVVTVTGSTQNITYISLDDRQIFIDEDGIFEEKLLLSPGQSIITLYARDNFEREKEVLLRYIYTGSTTEIQDNAIQDYFADNNNGTSTLDGDTESATGTIDVSPNEDNANL